MPLAHLTPTQRLIHLTLKTSDHPISQRDLADAIDSTVNTVQSRILEMIRAGLVIREYRSKHAYYSIPTVPLDPPTDDAAQQ